MKVGSVLEIITKLVPILKYYRERSVSEMLDDIYQKCCITAPPVDYLPPKPAKGKKANKDKPQLQDAGVLMKEMNKDEIVGFLNIYTKTELQQIAASLSIKIKSGTNKPEIIDIIASQAGNPIHGVLGAGRTEKEVNKDTDRLGAAAVQVTAMTQDEIVSFLKGFNKSEVLEISRRLRLQISSSNNKDNIILLIAKHFGYRDVNRRMAERPSRW